VIFVNTIHSDEAKNGRQLMTSSELMTR